MGEFSKDAFVKVVSVSGNYRYGYIQKVEERGLHLIVCLHEEGDSAIEYESEAGAEEPDWDKDFSTPEKKIIPLLAKNLTTKDVAFALSLDPATIRGHIRTLRIKLGLDNRAQLITMAQGIDKRLNGEGGKVE